MKMLFIYTPSKYPGAEQTTPAQFFFTIAISVSLCSVVLSKKPAETSTQFFVLVTTPQQTYVTIFA